MSRIPSAMQISTRRTLQEQEQSIHYITVIKDKNNRNWTLKSGENDGLPIWKRNTCKQNIDHNFIVHSYMPPYIYFNSISIYQGPIAENLPSLEILLSMVITMATSLHNQSKRRRNKNDGTEKWVNKVHGDPCV